MVVQHGGVYEAEAGLFGFVLVFGQHVSSSSSFGFRSPQQA